MASQRHDQRADQLAAAWDSLARAGRTGPFDERTCRLFELAIAIGTRDREAVRDAHQRAIKLGVFGEELDQLVTLAAATIGRPATIATARWLGLVEPRGTSAEAPPTNPKPTDA